MNVELYNDETKLTKYVDIDIIDNDMILCDNSISIRKNHVVYFEEKKIDDYYQYCCEIDFSKFRNIKSITIE